MGIRFRLKCSRRDLIIILVHLAYQQQKFLTVVEAVKSKIKAPADSGRGFLVHRWPSCPQSAEEARGISGSLL